MLVERALQVRRQKAVHDVHARRQAQLGHAAQNQRLVGGLLRVLAEQHDPAGIQRAIDIVVAAVHVKRMLGQRTRTHLQHHRRALAGRMIVLLHAVHHTLARGKVHHALAAHRVCDGAALSRVLAFRFNRNRVSAKYIQLALGKGLLKQLAALC